MTDTEQFILSDAGILVPKPPGPEPEPEDAEGLSMPGRYFVPPPGPCFLAWMLR